MPEDEKSVTTIIETDASLLMDTPSSAKLNNMIFTLLKNKTLQEIIDFGYQLLGNPPLLVSNSVLIASPPNCEFANSTFLDMIQRTDPGCREPLYLISEQEFYEKQERCETPLLIDCKHLGLRLITAKILYNGNHVATLQVPESERKFSHQDVLYVHILAKFISSELTKPHLGNQFSDMLFRTKFLSVLEGNDSLPNLNWLHLLQEKESSVLCICVLRLPEQHNAQVQPSESVLRGDNYFCKGVFFNRDYVFLCTVNGPQQRETIRTHFQQLAEDYQGTVGISAEFSNSERILSYYKQAAYTLEAGFSMNGSGKVYEYDQFSIETILFDAACCVKIRSYFEPIYALISSADSAKGTDLLNTLEQYVAFNRDKAAISQHLNLHRNTLGFRLHCINSILGWSIDDGDAFYMLKIMNILRDVQHLIERSGETWDTNSAAQKPTQSNN